MKNTNYSTIYFLLILIFIPKLFSQEIKHELKIYKGSFNYAEAEYQYYENENLERIFEGKFKLTKENNLMITGQYLNNIRVGYWTKSKKIEAPSIDIIEGYGNYIDGKKNGDWTYKLNYDFTKKTHKSILHLTFNNDTLVGKFDLMDIEKNYNDHLSGIKGEFDEKGLMTGECEMTKDDHRDVIIEFYRGFLVKYIVRVKENGFFENKFLPNKEQLTKKIDELYNSKAEITSIYIDNYGKSYYDMEKGDKEFGSVSFNPIDSVIEQGLSAIQNKFKTFLTPFEKSRKYDSDNFFYKKPKILYIGDSEQKSYILYMPTIEHSKE